MKATRILLVIVILLSGIRINAQNIIHGIFAGANTNFVTVKSDYVLAQDYKMSPRIGYNVGYCLKTTKKKLGMMVSGELQRTVVKDNFGFTATDEYGTTIGDYDKKIINDHFIIHTMGTYKLNNRIFAGTGLACSFLLDSKIKSDFVGYNEFSTYSLLGYTNYQYKRISLYVPVIIGVNFNRLDLFIRFNKGITDKIVWSKVNKIKEYDNVLLLGLTFKFGKENNQ